ncbi:MAG: hypothetical protein IPG17_05980 [Sandaracinaceae bacterium]|jgi:hypothetical protein|nr:hypothetical protein [Sandaracinaceae bacterium]MBP7681343.1 hypothetical protein [Deltaproteobacteria bacterium]MBK6807718.1 hypothetical protein [Sandaracinaceae bacterium]MBK7155159.1 hypothetical protein [Sandaracinaceae bacterium]MBK7776235.1 hypothetical protein [Sandaracinaceae bacterium]
MARLTRFSLLAVLLFVPAVGTGCGGGGGGDNDMGPMFEPLDAGDDTCTNSTVTCSPGVVIDYQFCMNEDSTSCYVRRMGMSYDCASCTGIGACLEATETLVTEQCP